MPCIRRKLLFRLSDTVIFLIWNTARVVPQSAPWRYNGAYFIKARQHCVPLFGAHTHNDTQKSIATTYVKKGQTNPMKHKHSTKCP